MDESWQVCSSGGKIPSKKVAAVEKWGYHYKEVTGFLFVGIRVAPAFKLCAENVIFQVTLEQLWGSKPRTRGLTVAWVFMNVMECILG